MNDPGRLSDRGSLIGDRRRATNYETGCFGFAKPARMATSALVYGEEMSSEKIENAVVSGGVTIRSFSSSSVDRVQSRIFCFEAPIVRRWCFAAHPRRRGDRIEMLFAAVHWSLMALNGQTNSAVEWSLLGA